MGPNDLIDQVVTNAWQDNYHSMFRELRQKAWWLTEDDREAVVVDSFMVFRSRLAGGLGKEPIRTPENIRAYLNEIAKNILKNRWRLAYQQRVHLDGGDDTEYTDEDWAASLKRIEDRELLDQALEKLNKKLREAFAAWAEYEVGRNSDDPQVRQFIAAQLGVSVATYDRRRNAALKRLRKILPELAEGKPNLRIVKALEDKEADQ